MEMRIESPTSKDDSHANYYRVKFTLVIKKIYNTKTPCF